MTVKTEADVVNFLATIMDEGYHHVVKELQVVNVPEEVRSVIGQEQIRIDLAAYNRIDRGITFIEAERHLHPKHAMMYRPFADYVWMAIPSDAITGPQVTKEELKKHIEAMKKVGVGLIVVGTDDDLHYRILVHARLTKSLSSEVRLAVLQMFQERTNDRYQHWGFPKWTDNGGGE